MTAAKLIALAERVMALTEPDRETFMVAFDACHPMPPPDCEPAWRAENPKQPIYHAWKTRQVAFIKFVSAEAWLDAAMTLVLDGEHFPAMHAALSAMDRRYEFGRYVRTEADGCFVEVLARYLTASALRARAALGGDG